MGDERPDTNAGSDTTAGSGAVAPPDATAGSGTAATDDPGVEECLPLTDLQRRALISERGSIGLMVFLVVFIFVAAFIISLPLIFFRGRSFSAALPIAVLTVVGYMGWILWHRHQARRDIRSKVFVRYCGPIAFGGPDQGDLVLGTRRKVSVLDDEKPALAAFVPCRGEVDLAPHAGVIFEIRDEAGVVAYHGSAMRDVLGQRSGS